MTSFRVAAADLIIGADCAGCGAPAVTLCGSCAAALRPDPHVAWPTPIPFGLTSPTPVPPIASAAYDGPLRLALAQYKERGRFSLLRPLGHLLAASVCLAAPEGIRPTLVPIPSSRGAGVRRGYDAIGELAAAAAGQLRAIGIDCIVAPVLTHTRNVADQSGLSAAHRATNMHGALRVRSGRRPIGPDVVLVDDIITTGATLAEAVRVLSRAGSRPIGIATVAATGRRHGDARATSAQGWKKDLGGATVGHT